LKIGKILRGYLKYPSLSPFQNRHFFPFSLIEISIKKSAYHTNTFKRGKFTSQKQKQIAGNIIFRKMFN